METPPRPGELSEATRRLLAEINRDGSLKVERESDGLLFVPPPDPDPNKFKLY